MPQASWLTYRQICHLVADGGLTLGFIGQRVHYRSMEIAFEREEEAEKVNKYHVIT